MPTLEIKNISKTYNKGTVKALDNFSVTLTSGVYGLLGPNGAGKSTLMNIITDNLNSDSGEVLYEGEDIKKLGKDYRTVLGYMPQQQGLYDDFTLNRFLWYMAALKGLKKKEAKAKITSLLETVNQKDSAHKKLGSFSGGMKQRALIAQALLNDPEILILDEPTAGLDPYSKRQLFALLSALLLAFSGYELKAAGSVKDGTAPVDDLGYAAQVHLAYFAVQQAVVATLNANNLDALAQSGTNNRANRSIHAGRVAAAGQYTDGFNFLVHSNAPPKSNRNLTLV